MVSKYHFENSSLYIEGTDIPKNKLGITNSEEIHELERELLSEAYTVFIMNWTIIPFLKNYISKNYIAEHLKDYLNGRENIGHSIWQKGNRVFVREHL